MVLEGNIGDSQAKLSCEGTKKGKNPLCGLFHFLKKKKKIKQPKEKGHSKGTEVFLKTCALLRIYFLAHLISSPHSCDFSTINRGYVHQPGEPQHQGSPYVKINFFFLLRQRTEVCNQRKLKRHSKYDKKIV